ANAPRTFFLADEKSKRDEGISRGSGSIPTTSGLFLCSTASKRGSAKFIASASPLATPLQSTVLARGHRSASPERALSASPQPGACCDFANATRRARRGTPREGQKG